MHILRTEENPSDGPLMQTPSLYKVQEQVGHSMTRPEKLFSAETPSKSLNFQGNELKLDFNVCNWSYINKDFSASSDSYHAAWTSYSQAQHRANWIYPYISTVVPFAYHQGPSTPSSFSQNKVHTYLIFNLLIEFNYPERM